jgi:hypothetical protein
MDTVSFHLLWCKMTWLFPSVNCQLLAIPLLHARLYSTCTLYLQSWCISIYCSSNILNCFISLRLSTSLFFLNNYFIKDIGYQWSWHFPVFMILTFYIPFIISISEGRRKESKKKIFNEFLNLPYLFSKQTCYFIYSDIY